VVPPVRCAIYTRKSHDERADAQLGSIERQRELCEAYVASQAGGGWAALPDRFDDPGRSGGSLERPALQRLLEAVDAGMVDAIVVYKYDRMSRSLADFVGVLQRLDRAGVSFASVTQPISTADSAGRLMLNILLSFAQFERDLTGERARDWKAGARARGMWTSGPPPFGYRLEAGRLVIDAEQAEVVRWLYRRIQADTVFTPLAREMNARGFRNRKGGSFNGRLVKAILSSRTYRGEIPHDGGFMPGRHAAIVSERQWRRVQEKLAALGIKPHRW
jgi:DNA invertase Pin-like site-specific DNA recombinase